MKWPFFCWEYWKRESDCFHDGSGFWFRIYGYGLHFTNGPMLFSERNGYEKRLKLGFGWRVNILKADK